MFIAVTVTENRNGKINKIYKYHQNILVLTPSFGPSVRPSRFKKTHIVFFCIEPIKSIRAYFPNHGSRTNFLGLSIFHSDSKKSFKTYWMVISLGDFKFFFSVYTGYVKFCEHT